MSEPLGPPRGHARIHASHPRHAVVLWAMSRHVFLSFVEEDLTLVTLFRGQARNRNSALSFDDYSVKDPYNSTRADYIRSQIRPKISACSVLVCLVGAQTHRSSWVDWEIR